MPVLVPADVSDAPRPFRGTEGFSPIPHGPRQKDRHDP